MTTVPPGEDHSLTGRGDSPAHRFLDGHAACQELAVSGDQEQGVVNAYAEADHASQLRSPTRNVDQVGDERHRADTEGETEQSHPDREAHSDERSKRQEQDDDGGDQTDNLADAGLRLLEREEKVAAQLDLQRRALSGLGTELLKIFQVAGRQFIDHRVLDANEGYKTVG